MRKTNRDLLKEKNDAKLRDIEWQKVGKTENALNSPERYRPAPGAYEWYRPRYYSMLRGEGDIPLKVTW